MIGLGIDMVGITQSSTTQQLS